MDGRGTSWLERASDILGSVFNLIDFVFALLGLIADVLSLFG
jgi:hypothetical protein